MDEKKEIIVERKFNFKGKDYIARLYIPENMDGIYGEIVLANNEERPENMKSIVEKYLEPYGIKISIDGKRMTTHVAVAKLIKVLANPAHDEKEASTSLGMINIIGDKSMEKKWSKLTEFLKESVVDKIVLTHKQIEIISGHELPDKITDSSTGEWGNTQGHSLGKSWLNAGFKVSSETNPYKGIVTFVRDNSIQPKEKKHIDDFWNLLEQYEGEEFFLPSGVPFIYKMQNDSIILSLTKKKHPTKDDFQKVLKIKTDNQKDFEKELPDIGSYLYSILKDERMQ